MKRPIVIIESPYGGKDIDRNMVYLRRVLRDSWEKGEHPLASHAYYPFFLKESDPQERKEGIECGYVMWPLAQRVIFYTDYGISPGMQKALDRTTLHSIDMLTRTIGINP